jgi:hypothetical protein
MVRLSGTAEPAKRLELTEQLIRMVVVHAMTEETVNIARLWLKHVCIREEKLICRNCRNCTPSSRN